MTFDEVMAHHGVKGMKWGQHKQGQLEKMHKIASGDSRAIDTVHFMMNVPLTELAAHGNNIRAVAAGRAVILQAQKDRIQAGKATRADKIDRWMNTPITDLIKGR